MHLLLLLTSDNNLLLDGAMAVFFYRIFLILCVFSSFIPIHFTQVSGGMWLLSSMAIFYFAITRPYVVPAWFVFILGIFSDFMSGTPIGMHAVINVFFREMAVKYGYRPGDTIFLRAWQKSVLIFTALFSLQWVIFSSYYKHMLSVQAMMVQLLLVVLLYPVFHAICSILFGKERRRRTL